MPVVAWIVMWAVVLGTVAFFAVREVRAKKGMGPADLAELRDPASHAGGGEALSHLPQNLQGPSGM